mgnify:CR=1 FL=1
MFQFCNKQVFNSTVYDEICFGLKCFGSNDVDSKIKKSISMVGLNESFLFRNPYNISNGERRLVALASVLCYEPEIIILDEPTVGLDNSYKIQLMKLLKRLKNEFNVTNVLICKDLRSVVGKGGYLRVIIYENK